MARVGIFGATGYVGYELIKMLVKHAETEIVFATSRSSAGKRLSDLYPCPYDLPLVAPEDAALDEADAAFVCLPHGESMATVQRVRAAGGGVIELTVDPEALTPRATLSQIRAAGLER